MAKDRSLDEAKQAETLHEATPSIVVGEPTGARPNGYQENYWFTLPESKLRASCAALKYRFQPDADTEAVFPDKRIDPDWHLFTEGKTRRCDGFSRNRLRAGPVRTSDNEVLRRWAADVQIS